MDFKKLQTTKLGELAEQMVVDEFITSKGYTPLVNSIDGPHEVDAIATSRDTTKKPFALEIKAKSRLLYYNASGMDKNDYEFYSNFGLPVYILFVDPTTKSVYGNWVNKLELMTIGNRTDLFYFNRESMIHYRDLTEEEANILKKLENSNYQ